MFAETLPDCCTFRVPLDDLKHTPESFMGGRNSNSLMNEGQNGTQKVQQSDKVSSKEKGTAQSHYHSRTEFKFLQDCSAPCNRIQLSIKLAYEMEDEIGR